MKIGEYEGYTITVSNPEGMEEIKRSWLGHVIEDQERAGYEKKKVGINMGNSRGNNLFNSVCNV